jgi:hypothetical protein
MILVKRGPKKSSAQKTEFSGGKIVFWLELVLVALSKFYDTHQNYEILSKSLVPTGQYRQHPWGDASFR